MDMSQRVAVPVSLESLPHRQQATVAAIDWTHLSTPEARRLRELGFDEGVGVEVLHRASLGKGPIACRIGRMTVALRRAVASTILVAPVTQ
jgi:ferrous iron transport protein A